MWNVCLLVRLQKTLRTHKHWWWWWWWWRGRRQRPRQQRRRQILKLHIHSSTPIYRLNEAFKSRVEKILMWKKREREFGACLQCHAWPPHTNTNVYEWVWVHPWPCVFKQESREKCKRRCRQGHSVKRVKELRLQKYSRNKSHQSKNNPSKFQTKQCKFSFWLSKPTWPCPQLPRWRATNTPVLHFHEGCSAEQHSRPRILQESSVSDLNERLDSHPTAVATWGLHVGKGFLLFKVARDPIGGPSPTSEFLSVHGAFTLSSNMTYVFLRPPPHLLPCLISDEKTLQALPSPELK